MLIINFFQPDNNKTIFKYLLLIVWRQMSQRRTTGKYYKRRKGHIAQLSNSGFKWAFKEHCVTCPLSW